MMKIIFILLLFISGSAVSQIDFKGPITIGRIAVPTISSTNSLTNKGINLANNTLTGTLAHFNSAISDADITPTSRTITINGTAQDLSANRSWTVTGSDASKVDTNVLPINIQKWGAVGDDATDNGAIIRRAIDTAYARGRAIYVPTGVFRVGISGYTVGVPFPALVVKPGIVMFGDGESSVIKKVPTEIWGAVMEYDRDANDSVPMAARNYTFRNLKFVGTTYRGYEAPGATSIDHGFFFANADSLMNRFIIDNVTLTNFNKEAIAVWGAREAFITNNKVYNSNFNAYNPQQVGKLIMTGNYAETVSFGCEYISAPIVYGDTSYAVIENNNFVNVYEYGIDVEGGGRVKINGNFLKGNGGASISGASTGIYIIPNVDSIGTLEISNNTIDGFATHGIAYQSGDNGYFKINDLIIKNNLITNCFVNAINLHPFSIYKIRRTEIFNNTMRNWNVDNEGSFEYSAIALYNVQNANIHNNRSYGTDSSTGARNDPLYISDCSNIRFIGNNVMGPASQFYNTLEIRRAGTNTNITVANNPGLGGAVTGELVTLTYDLGDETTTITTGTAKKTFRIPQGMRITEVSVSLTTASSSGNPAFDINVAGSSIFSTVVTIDANEETSVTAATPYVLAVPNSPFEFAVPAAADAKVTVDFDAVGTGAKGPKLKIVGYK